LGKGRRVDEISAIEFGVANGAGLLNMCEIARKVTEATGVKIRIFGFDRGSGLPGPKDYRDHPESYQIGHCPMQDPERLQALVKKQNATLLIGEISDLVPQFLRDGAPPIGFISMDVDYYSSTVEALQILQGDHHSYLPWIILYLDDVDGDRHNRFCGELGAVQDFNSASKCRKIQEFNFLQKERLFQRPYWIEKMYIAHILDHPIRERDLQAVGGYVLDNPYL
jgi:hypothetical protein